MFFWIGFSVLYFVLLVTVGVMTVVKGHWVLFILGVFFPVLWIIGAFLPAGPEADAPAGSAHLS
jgi:hypothetical protein